MYIQTLLDQVKNRRKKRSVSSGYAAAPLVYVPRVWDKKTDAWVPSSDIDVSKAVILNGIKKDIQILVMTKIIIMININAICVPVSIFTAAL